MENKQEINSLQDVINKRAEEKLKKDLYFLANLPNYEGSKYYRLLTNININIGTADKPRNINAVYVFSIDERIYKEAFDNNIKRYIEEETKLFIKEIEELREKTKELENNFEDLLYEVNR